MPLSPDALERLKDEVLHPELTTWAVIDGAGCTELLDRLDDWQPEHICLYRGNLEPEVAQTAPHMARLRRDDPFTDWLLGEGWGKAWFVLVQSGEEPHALRSHFRRLLMVRLPDGQIVYFRFYDPRVLRLFLPTCDARQVASIVGRQQAILMEAEAVDHFHLFRLGGGGLSMATLPITGGQAAPAQQTDWTEEEVPWLSR